MDRGLGVAARIEGPRFLTMAFGGVCDRVGSMRCFHVEKGLLGGVLAARVGVGDGGGEIPDGGPTVPAGMRGIWNKTPGVPRAKGLAEGGRTPSESWRKRMVP